MPLAGYLYASLSRARFAVALSYLVAVVASVRGIYADDDPTVLGTAFIVNTFLFAVGVAVALGLERVLSRRSVAG